MAYRLTQEEYLASKLHPSNSSPNITFGELWWSQITLPFEQIPMCMKCKGDNDAYFKRKSRNQSIDDFRLSCTRHCLWHDYFVQSWDQDEIFTIYKYLYDNTRGRSASNVK